MNIVIKKYIAYLVYDEDNPTEFTKSFEVGDSPMPAIFEQQESFSTAKLALREARKFKKELLK